MALSYIWKLQTLWPFSLPKDELRVSDDLVQKLPIPEQTKQFVFALRVPESESVVYILTTQTLSERSALDADCLIRKIHPEAVVAQVALTVSSELGNGTDDPVPTSAFRVLMRCFVDKINKEKYEDAAANFVLRAIFGTNFNDNFFAAKKAAEEVGCSFLMLESPYVKNSFETSYTKKSDARNSFPGFLSSLVAQKAAGSSVSSNLRFCLTDSVQSHMVKMVSSYMDGSASISITSPKLTSAGVQLQSRPDYEPPPFAQSIYPLLTDLQNIFKDIPSVERALIHAQKLLSDVNRGEAVNAQILSEVYSFRVAVEGLRIALNNSGRLPITKTKDSSLSKVEFSELSLEDRAHALFAHALRNQAKTFKTIVAVVDASALSGLRKHWNAPVPKEVEDMVEQIVTEDIGETSNDQAEKRRLLSGSSVVAVSAGATAVVGASSLSKVVPASTFVKMATLNVPASFKIMASQTQKVIVMALAKSLGPSKVIAPGLASASKTSAMKAALSAEKIRAVAHGIIASAEKTSISAMRTSFYEIMRKRQVRSVGPLPWLTFGCSLATCVGLLSYGDGIECVAESLPSAPSIASLGRGIQGLHRASESVRQTDSSRIQKSIESLMYRLKKGKLP